MINNKGKTALVFGIRNNGSIAFSVAQKLMESGCRVAFSYLGENTEEVQKVIEKYQLNQELAYEVDVRDEAAIGHFISDVYAKTGRIDYILHAVAYGNEKVMCTAPFGSKETPPDYLDMPLDDFMDSFNISAYSLLRICRVAAPKLTAGASILTLTHHAAQEVFPGYAGMAINKAALENLVKYLAHYFGPKSIRINAISAGLIMSTSALGIKGVRQFRRVGKYAAPLGNVSAEDVANAALYYFSDFSGKVTGNIHYVDGGLNILGVTNYEK